MNREIAIFELWDSAESMGDDIGERGGTVRMWRQRGIPPKHWPKIARAAQANGHKHVTLEYIAHICESQRAA
jgi:hypothetical protein